MITPLTPAQYGMIFSTSSELGGVFSATIRLDGQEGRRVTHEAVTSFSRTWLRLCSESQ